MATERGPLEERFCPWCGGGNPPVALHCMCCGRRLAAESAAPGRSGSTGYTVPVQYSMANRLELRPLSPGQHRVLRAVGLGLIAVGALVSVGLALVAMYSLAPPVYSPGYSHDTRAGLAAFSMAGLLVACMLLILPGYILTEMGRFQAGRSEGG